MKILLFLVVLIFPLHMFATHHPKVLHAIIAADTMGWKIEKASIADLKHMEQSLYALAYHLHLAPQIQVLKDQDCSVDSIKNAVLSLKGFGEDIVVFVYSGHGSLDPCNSFWPVMNPSGGATKVGLRASSVVRFFQVNKHQLAILLFDCCNKFPASGPCDSVPRSQEFVITTNERLPGLKKLFLHSEGLIIGTAASRGEYATCYIRGPEIGGVFINSLLCSLKEGCAKEKVSWHELFHKIEKYCPKHTRRDPQHPILRYEQ